MTAMNDNEMPLNIEGLYELPLPGFLTDKEIEAVRMIGQAVELVRSEFGEDYNILDSQQLIALAHSLQRFILANAAARIYPSEFRVLGA